MSSLWTPGGEIPVEREPSAPKSPEAGPASAPPPPEGTAADQQEQLEQMRQQLLDAPAGDVIAQHLMAFYELAAMHLGADSPRLADASAAIDAIEAVLGRLAGRLGAAEEAISQALPQLKMAFVETKDQVERRGNDGD